MSATESNIPDEVKIKMYLDRMQHFFSFQLWLWHPGISYCYRDIRDFKDEVHDCCEGIRKILGFSAYVYKSPDGL